MDSLDDRHETTDQEFRSFDSRRPVVGLGETCCPSSSPSRASYSGPVVPVLLALECRRYPGRRQGILGGNAAIGSPPFLGSATRSQDRGG